MIYKEIAKMGKKEDQAERVSKSEMGKAIGDLMVSLVRDPELLAALLQDDDVMTEQELAEQTELADQIRHNATTATDSLLETLAVIERINALLWQGLWQEESLSPGELQVTDLIQRGKELQAYCFAPWLHDCLQQELASLATKDDEECIAYAAALVSVLNGIAHQLFDSKCYEEEPAEGVPKNRNEFYAWWSVVIQTMLSLQSDEDDAEDDEGFNDAQLAFIELSVVDKYQFLAERLQAFGLKVAPLDATQLETLQQQEYFDFTEALLTLLPERSNGFAVAPFGAYTAQELFDFYPQHWQAASEATGGEWIVQGLETELSDQDGDTIISVSFNAFGEQHEWEYTHDSSYSDISFFDDLIEFSREHLRGRFVFDDQNECEIGYVYLPPEAADEIEQYLKTF
jgi:hypothetical protein